PQTAGLYSGIWPLAFTPGGKGLVSYGDDRRFRLWDPFTGKEAWSRPLVLSGVPRVPDGRPEDELPPEAMVWAVRMSPDGLAGAVAVGGAVYVVDPMTGQELFKLPGQHRPGGLAFSGDGRTLAWGGWDKQVRLWDVTTSQELLRV